MVGSFLLLLQYSLSGGSILQRKLTEDFTEPVHTDLSYAVGRMTEEQQEWMEPGGEEEGENEGRQLTYSSCCSHCNQLLILYQTKEVKV